MEIQVQQFGSQRVNIGKIERGLSLASGLVLLAYVLTRRTRIGLPLGLDAGYLIYRGATGHCVIYEAMRINRAKPTSVEERIPLRHQDVEQSIYEPEDVVEIASEDSFPASDAPGWVSSRREKVG